MSTRENIRLIARAPTGIHSINFFNLNKLSVSKQQHLCYKLTVYNYWRDANYYQQEKKTPVFIR